MVRLMEVVLKALPKNSILYIDHSIEDACDMNYLSEISNYIIGIDKLNQSGYSYAILLSDECISYLISEFSSEPESLAFLTHYCIIKDEICYLQVLDSSILDILDSISISDELLTECEHNPDIHLYFSNPVRESLGIFNLDRNSTL